MLIPNLVSMNSIAHSGASSIDWHNNKPILALLTFDWIQECLTGDEQRRVLLPLLDYIECVQPQWIKNEIGVVGNPSDPSWSNKENAGNSIKLNFPQLFLDTERLNQIRNTSSLN